MDEYWVKGLPLTAESDCYQGCLSGHLAPLVVSSRDVAQIMSLDAFAGEGPYETMSEGMRGFMRRIWGTRIMPLTADGYPIVPN